PYGGEGDLGRGIVRVLHNLSFIEDPTRIFRAIRYQNRYVFDMDGLTLQLARSCVEMGLVGDLSGARVRDELVALLGEEEVAGALVSVDQLGLAGAVHPALDCGPASVHLVERLDRARRRHAPELPPWRGRLGAGARGHPARAPGRCAGGTGRGGWRGGWRGCGGGGAAPAGWRRRPWCRRGWRRP